MFGSSSRQDAGADDAWRALVERLELQDASSWATRLRSFLALGDDARIERLYRSEIALGGDHEGMLYFFEYEAPSSRRGISSQVLSGGCMLSVPHDLGAASLRVTQRPAHKVLEALGASATGSSVVRFPEDSAFNDAVTVYARDEEAARSLLRDPARAMLQRALFERGVAPTFLLGERQLLFFTPIEASDAGRLSPLELLATDLLSLYAVFSLTVGNRAG